MKRSPDDDEDSGGVFDGIEEMLSGMTGGDAAPVDVHEYDDEVRVVADIPEAEREDIHVRCDGRTVAIRAATDPRPFRARADLPAYVDAESARTNFNNGVFEVTFDRDTDPANIGFH